MRAIWFIGPLLLALLIGIDSLQTPAPRPVDAASDTFSAGRAMVDIEALAASPHPLGSLQHQAVQDLLVTRLEGLGLKTERQSGALSPAAINRMGPERATAAQNRATNIVGVLEGSQPDLPMVMMMAHYDTVPGSPGAADDSTGVAAILETVRAIRTQGQPRRSLVVLFSDAEELNLDGARIFFGDHRLRDRIGAVVNLEARGGGGRAMMFETGPGNRQTINLLAGLAGGVDGGVTSNSLAVFVYEQTPNGTDFTIARNRGIAGLNFAFIGRPAQYHSATSTPEALDKGSVQHIGALALASSRALLAAPELPQTTRNAVYADALTLGIIAYPPGVGWGLILIALSAVLLAFWGACHGQRFKPVEVLVDMGRGAMSGLWLMSLGLVVAHGVRLLAGDQAQSAELYYTLLRRLPWIEAGVVLAMVALGLLALGGKNALIRGAPGRLLGGRRMLAAAIAVLAVVVIVAGGFSPVVLGMAVVAVILTLWNGASPRTDVGANLGLIMLILILGTAAQILVPEATPLLLWPALLGAIAVAASAVISASGRLRIGRIPAVLATVLGGAWLVSLSHPVFLGIGMDLPGVLALMALLVVMLVRPLVPQVFARGLALSAGVILIVACGVSLSARIAEPMTVAAAPSASDSQR